MTAATNTLHRSLTADDYAAAAARRRLRLAGAGLLLALLVAVTFVGMGKDTPLLPLAVLIIVFTPVLLWRYPHLCLYTLFAAACLFELNPSDFPDALTERVPFFWNVNSIFQVYAHQDVKAVPLNVMEIFTLTAGVCSVLKAVYTRTVRVRGGALLLPIAAYLAFVALGWIVGMAGRGDFKVSLQEVRSQFYFGLAYLVAVNSLRDRAQIGILLKIFAVCVGLKGILLTVRRYVTLHGLPLPDQGVGAHEEAFFFDAFVILLIVLTLCNVHKRLRWLMWALFPFVQIANLACNRRAATAAMVIVVPVLIAAVLRALPERRKLVTGITLALLAAFMVYFPAFRHKGGMIAQPARAIQSQIEPDSRDASSNAYRDAENADLMATIKSAPLGYGYGRHMLHAVPIADISKTYEWWDVMTHNQILWVWMRVGTLGFVAFWLMVSAILIQACLTLRAPDATSDTRVVALFTLLTVGMLMIFGLLDLQLSNFRDMLFAGFWAGALAAVGCAPDPVRRVFAAPANRFYAYAARTTPLSFPPSAPIGTASPVPIADRRGVFRAEDLARPIQFQRRQTDFASPAPPSLGAQVGSGASPHPAPPKLGAGGPPDPTAPPAPRIARNLATTLVTQLLTWGLTFIVTLYLPGYVGDTGLGALTLAGAFAAVFALLVGLGTSTVLIKDIARDHARAGELALAALALRVPLGLAAVMLGWAISFALGYDARLRELIVLALGAMCVAQIGDALGAVLRGLELIPRQNAAALAEKIVTSILTVALVLARAPLWTIVVVTGVGSLVSLTIAAVSLRPHWHDVHRPTWATVKGTLTAGMPFLTTAVFMAIYGQADAVLLSKMSSVAAVGWYGLAKRLGGTTLVIPVAVAGTLLPTLSRLWHADRPAFDTAVRRLWSLMLIAVVPFAAVLTLAPAHILTLLHYPRSFAHSIPVLVLMGGAVILWFLSQVAGTALIASDRQAALSRCAGIAALLSIPLCAGGIYLTQRVWHNGAVGAMLSDVLVEAYLVAGYVRALPPGLVHWRSLGVLARAGIAALPLVGLFHFAHAQWGLLWLVPGLLVYIPLCLALGCLHADDLAALRRMIARRTL